MITITNEFADSRKMCIRDRNFVDLLSKVLHRNFGEGIRLTYRVVTDKEHIACLNSYLVV